MSEELIQRNLIEAPEKIGAWNYYNIGATTLKALKAAKIILNKDYDEYESKKPDALIVKMPQVIAAIEYKQPKEFRTKKQIKAAITQEIGTARVLGAKIYIVTDGQKTFWINPLTGNEIKTEDGSRVSLNFNKNDVECVKLISKAIASVNAINDTIFASAVVDPLPLAQRVWQDLWAVSGATPENCLYTFVEIFIFKYLSDLGILTGSDSFYDLLSRYTRDSDERVLEIYASTIRRTIKDLFPMNLKDKTTIINGTIFVSKDDNAVSGYATVFKKILERFRDFGTLENIDYDFKSKLFETFLKESISKKNWGQFFTPLKVVRAIVSMADISTGMKICDPACGVGKFLLEPILHDIHRYYKIENGQLIPQITLSGFDKGFDKDEQKTIILAKANMLIYMSSLIKEYPDITKQFAELFNNTFLLQTNSILGTLAKPTTDEYDLILTNPPYVMNGSSNLKEEISKKTPEEIAKKQKSLLGQHYAVSAMGVEGLFMEWIIRALKPGGKAFVIVPDGIMNRSNDKRLREFILEECEIDAVISLPLNTFFTTNKKTYIMVLTKKVAVMTDGVPAKQKQTAPVFTYLCSEIGETRDVYRFDIEQNDLDKAATLYNMFKGVRSVLPIDDKRCKIVSIDEFYNGSHWSVERWWTQVEKVALGIEDEVATVTVEDFITFVEDAVFTLTEFTELLRELVKKKSDTECREIENSDISSNYVTSKFPHFKKVKISELFELPKIKGVTKKFIRDNNGTIPVYGGRQNEEPIGFIADELEGVKYFENCLAWNREGSVGYVFFHNHKFTTNDHHRPMILKTAYIGKIDLMYIRAVLEKLLLSSDDFAWSKTASKEKISKIEISIPIDDCGNFDLKAQHLIAGQFTLLDDMRDEIEKKYRKITDCDVRIDMSEYAMREFSLCDVLEPIKGKSKYTKKYGNMNKGKYPVFSASSNFSLTYIDTFDYDGNYLSWSTNGFAGTVTVLNNKFSINGDRGILLPKVENIDIQYLKYTLQPIFRGLAKGRKGDRGVDEFTKLYPSMIADVQIPFPVSEDGEISLIAQQEIAQKYVVIEQLKKEILEKLSLLIEQKVLY
ncbi:MAG: putative type I restriction enzymeP M protein [Pelotomaculum sp. PtaU1.Bin035]|nr:MAG: putative type I restriction enzymeP M protein [Pelotomaculum sp. PtaU1.Bin035]